MAFLLVEEITDLRKRDWESRAFSARRPSLLLLHKKKKTRIKSKQFVLSALLGPQGSHQHYAWAAVES